MVRYNNIKPTRQTRSMQVNNNTNEEQMKKLQSIQSNMSTMADQQSTMQEIGKANDIQTLVQQLGSSKLKRCAYCGKYVPQNSWRYHWINDHKILQKKERRVLRLNETPVEPYWATEPPLSFFRDQTFVKHKTFVKHDRVIDKISFGRRLKYKKQDKTFIGQFKTDEMKLKSDDVNQYIAELQSGQKVEWYLKDVIQDAISRQNLDINQIAEFSNVQMSKKNQQILEETKKIIKIEDAKSLQIVIKSLIGEDSN